MFQPQDTLPFLTLLRLSLCSVILTHLVLISLEHVSVSYGVQHSPIHLHLIESVQLKATVNWTSKINRSYEQSRHRDTDIGKAVKDEGYMWNRSRRIQSCRGRLKRDLVIEDLVLGCGSRSRL